MCRSISYFPAPPQVHLIETAVVVAPVRVMKVPVPGPTLNENSFDMQIYR